MKKRFLLLSVAAFAVLTTFAALNYNQVIIAIFGSGNPDTGWTTATESGLTLALRSKNREDGSTANVSGVYNSPTGYQAPNNNRARSNFELSINSGDFPLDTYDYYVGIDLDPSVSVNWLVVNALTFWNDNSYGDATTLNGQGVEGPASVYASNKSIAQNSQNIVFYGLDPTQNATYSYELYAVPAGSGPNGPRIATVAITVIYGTGGSLPPDDDGDGVANSIDQCPGTNPGEVVDVNGCSVQDFVEKCAVENASDHGEYVACVVDTANTLFKAGIISKEKRKELINAAAQSDIGKGGGGVITPQ